ncbi:RNA-binding protein S4 [Hypericibacter adhaerens]|uniref:RNA-binding protein S4 n=1 Tax=Hypericibacter adhaerens TaxID=2602016 RepID=A0A5J6NAN7_9PROT|nr:RNA-binding S4 domain-containing protein [Hypericibacter adhaerens]QEX24926.1 RNA-binding protein S4 [Hypericibacter adhaerens]
MTAPVPSAPEAPSLRLDKWLWQARFCKSRSLASKLCVAGQIRLAPASQVEGGALAAGVPTLVAPTLVAPTLVAKPSQTVRPGDVLTFALAGQVRVIRILKLGERRGPAPEARTLYQDLTPPQSRISQEPGPGTRAPGSGRPTKRERRALDRLQEDEG